MGIKSGEKLVAQKLKLHNLPNVIYLKQQQ